MSRDSALLIRGGSNYAYEQVCVLMGVDIFVLAYLCEFFGGPTSVCQERLGCLCMYLYVLCA